MNKIIKENARKNGGARCGKFTLHMSREARAQLHPIMGGRYQDKPYRITEDQRDESMNVEDVATKN